LLQGTLLAIWMRFRGLLYAFGALFTGFLGWRE
jgi:hypothetical protein